MLRVLVLATNFFPFWVLLAGVLALFQPAWFTWFRGPWVVWGLAVIMLGMGITLTVRDFQKIGTMPRAVGAGLFGQFLIMPFLGWSLAHGMKLPPEFAAGLILVACCPGGTASNVVAYMARANVALSVVMTMCSTFAAIALTPMLTKGLAGTLVPVNAWALFWSTVQVVLAPVLLGVVLNRFVPSAVRLISPVAPLISVLTIALICGSAIGQNAQAVREAGLRLGAAVLLLHLGGFALGYGFARWLGYDQWIARTVSIEVGMQNSGLAVVLATRHFSPLASVPGALSASCHSIVGSACAAVWRARSVRSGTETAAEGPRRPASEPAFQERP